MMPPTIAQQRGMAYAPMPFAIASFLSSSYVIYHILWQQPQKRQRLYHRLVLAMNVAVMPLSLNYLLGSFAVPEGTPYYAAAAGTIQSCTAAGFIAIMLTMTVPIYYGSFGMLSYMSIKHDFKEEKYKWTEKWVHLSAWIIPAVISSVIAAYEGFNPAGSGCSVTASPLGCDWDPVACERGGGMQMQYFVFIVIFGQILLYFVIPPCGMVAVRRIVTKKQVESETSTGMRLIREMARKHMMRNITLQVSVYLLSFWITFVPTVIHFIYLTLTGSIMYNLLILAICVFASQGFILTGVYFSLAMISKPKVENFHNKHKPQLSVEDIRSSAERKAERGEQSSIRSRQASIIFSIFDGTPDNSSPWAQFIDEDDYEENGAIEQVNRG